MIIWNAFLNYFVMPGEKVKIIVLCILILSLIMRRREVIRGVYEQLQKIPTRTLLLVLFSLAFLLRLGWVLWSPHTAPSAGTEDMIMLRHARDLASGRGYLTSEGAFSADRPIGYPIFLAFVFKMFGENIGLVEFLQIVFSVLGVFTVFCLGRQVCNREVGFFAALLLALFPTSIFASKVVLEEHVFIPLWLLGINIMISDLKKPSWKKIVAQGLIFGIAAHFRTYAFAMGLVVFFWWLVNRKGIGPALLRGLAIQLLILSLALPWAIRNYVKLGEPIFYTTWIGAALYFANNDTTDVRHPINPTVEQGGDEDFARATTELERNRAGKKAALKWIVKNPGTFIQKGAGRIIYMLGLSREGWIVKDNFYTLRPGRAQPKKGLIRFFDKLDNDYYGNIFLFALLGLAIFCFTPNVSRPKGLWLIIFTFAYYLAFVALTPGQRKYRFSIEPFFCILAAYALFTAWFGHVAEWLNFKESPSSKHLSRPITSL